MRRLNRDSAPHLMACAVDYLRGGISTKASRLGAAWWGVSLGEGCKFFGLPIFRRLPGTTISVAARCVFRSAPWSNMAGVNRPCILATLAEGARLEIASDCGFSGAVIGAASSVVIGARVMVGANGMISDTDWHPIDPIARARGELGRHAPVVIEEDVWLGAHVVVLKGVRIGAGTTVAANSVVTQSLPPGIIAGGVPARQIGSVASDLQQRPKN